MREEPGKSSSLRESGYRVVVLVVVISCHLGLLVLLLRPVIFYRNGTPVARNDARVIKLRFFRRSQPSLSPLVVRRSIEPAGRSHATSSARSSKPPAVPPAAHIDAQPYEARSTSARNQGASEDDSTSDGGFRERLREAQHAYSVHGVPGSDMPLAPGIHLVDPMSQGMGALMRTVQRASGIKNSHCIDADVWRHLAPRELSARHVSPGDVDKVGEEYGCNEPPGLRF